jgi:TrmH family RNA methyltransferase
MAVVITSVSNPLIKRTRSLQRSRDRRLSGLTLVEGAIVFSRMADMGVTPEAILMIEDDDETATLCATHGWTPLLVSQEVLASASDTVHPQSPVVVIPIPLGGAMRERDTLLLMDISDPGNVGTMIRSAAAFGWDVCVAGASADPWSPKVVRAGAGSHFDIHHVASDDPMADASALGIEIVASVVAGGDQPRRIDRPIALMIGSEAHGLPRENVTSAERRITLSMRRGVESLNAGVAASILMYLLASDTGTS